MTKYWYVVPMNEYSFEEHVSLEAAQANMTELIAALPANSMKDFCILECVGGSECAVQRTDITFP